jgi:CRP-like cAMP-binding protein
MLAVPYRVEPRWDAGERAALLASVPLFERVAPATLKRLAEGFRPKRVLRGEFVFLEGEPANALNLVAEGRIKMIRETREGRQVILRLINPGELFGVSGGWGESLYPSSARALGDAVVLQLPARQFTALLAQYPELAMAVIHGLADRLREAEARVLDLQTERVEQRMARALLRLAGATGPVSAAGSTGRLMEVALSRQDLADLSGTTLSTASRTLSAWHRRGIVLAGREQVTILDLPALQALAG